MSYKRLKQKVIMLSDEEMHYCEVLKKVYKINPSKFIRDAFVEKLKNEIPKIRTEFNSNKDLPF